MDTHHSGACSDHVICSIILPARYACVLWMVVSCMCWSIYYIEIYRILCIFKCEIKTSIHTLEEIVLILILRTACIRWTYSCSIEPNWGRSFRIVAFAISLSIAVYRQHHSKCIAIRNCLYSGVLLRLLCTIQAFHSRQRKNNNDRSTNNKTTHTQIL